MACVYIKAFTISDNGDASFKIIYDSSKIFSASSKRATILKMHNYFLMVGFCFVSGRIPEVTFLSAIRP